MQELNEYVQNGTLNIRTAFSRDQAEKIYVTNLLRDDTDLVWNVIENKGHVYICGYVFENLFTIQMNFNRLIEWQWAQRIHLFDSLIVQISKYFLLPFLLWSCWDGLDPNSDAKNMANDVRNILINIIKTKGNMDEAAALQYLKKMEAQKRYSADVWS